jgi:hypothetical protein
MHKRTFRKVKKPATWGLSPGSAKWDLTFFGGTSIPAFRARRVESGECDGASRGHGHNCPARISRRLLQITRFHAGCRSRTRLRKNGEEGYGLIESDVLFALIIRHLPARIIQFGAGVSTALILHATEVQATSQRSFASILTTTLFLTRSAGIGAIRLTARRVQDVDIGSLPSLTRAISCSSIQLTQASQGATSTI